MAAYVNDNLNAFLFNTLGHSTGQKCEALTNFVDGGSIRNLQEAFPRIVHDVFGLDGGNGIGWGLRTITKKFNANHFSILRQFFSVNGTMLRYCHRLLSDGITFEISADLIPAKVIELSQSGSLFYTELVNIDPYTRRVSSLTVNAFDFYILHFALHGLQPLHRMNPQAQEINNERLQSVYSDLTYDYLNNFMPGYSDVEVMPPLVNSNLKAPQIQFQMQSMQTVRKPRYLKVPPAYNSSNMTNILNVNSTPGGPRAYTWRTESVLHFFIDIWLRYDVEGQHDLPGSELVRNVRALIKQTHFFANAAHMDSSPMAQLRKIAQPMIKALTYQFLRGLIDRWPLDGSMTVVLELWLSYIQPWRYNAYSNNSQRRNQEIVISSQYDNFIADNLMMYTQIFWRLLPRFERLDYSIYGNGFMLYRMAKVFAQPGLGNRIREIEKVYYNNNSYPGCESSPRHTSYNRHSTFSSNDSRNATNLSSFYNDMMPCLMFSETMCKEIDKLLNFVNVSRISSLQTIKQLNADMQKKRSSEGFIKNYLRSLLGSRPQEEEALLDVGRIPEVLCQSIIALSSLFKIPLPSNFLEDPNETMPLPTEPQNDNQEPFSIHDISNNLNLSQITPMNMSKNSSKNFPLSMDPALVPFRCNEIIVLVKILHCISKLINNNFGPQLEFHYNRNDIIGKLLRQVLYEPTTIQWFDKVSCETVLHETVLPPRLCLRPLASFPILTIIGIALISGALLSTPMTGLLTLGILYACYIFVLAILS